MEKFKEEIIRYLKTTDSFDFTTLQNNVTKIALKYQNNGDIYDYWVVCDNTNNYPYIINQKLIIVDVYFKQNKGSDTICLNITMKVDKIKILQKKRKKKLQQIYEL